MAESKRVLTRRDFAKGAGLLIGFAATNANVVPRLLAQVAAPRSNATGNPAPGTLDAWLKLDADGTFRVFSGKVEIGMGVETALTQVIAEELDISPSRVTLIMGDTSKTPDQGGVGGSTSLASGAKCFRNAAASARAILLRMAATRLNVQPGELEVRDGVVTVKGDASRRVTYAELAQDADFRETLKVSGSGSTLDVQGQAKPKDPSQYKVVGKSLPRIDLPPKIFGKWQYVVDVRLPGMLHGRVIRPTSVGATFARMDESAAKQIPGYVRTVVKENFVGVLAENEWAAIQAMRALKVTWTPPEKPAFPEYDQLYDHMRETAPTATTEVLKKGDVDAGMAKAATKISATYAFPFQAHCSMGPGCGVADVRPDGTATVWTGTQKPHATQIGIAALLKVEPDKVRLIWTEDSGSYGRCGFEDALGDAVILSQAAGRPVRVQWMRSDMTTWGSKGPATLVNMEAGLDATGKVTAFRYTARAYSGAEVNYLPITAGNFLGAQLAGIPNDNVRDEYAQWGKETVGYTFENILAKGEVLSALHPNASSLRATHLRDPGGLAATFGSESFIDEMAFEAGMDPIAFRLANLPNDRIKAALQLAAEKFGWESRPSPNPKAKGNIVTGRGVALGDRGGTYVATIVEVEVDRSTGIVRAKRMVCTHDCGLIVNPAALEGTVSANLVQSLSRSLFEEVRFDKNNVTSTDWVSYPVLRSADLPQSVEVHLINRPDRPSSGAGEPASRPTPAAVSNAIFDAIGARVREAPFTPKRVMAALEASAGKQPVSAV